MALRFVPTTAWQKQARRYLQNLLAAGTPDIPTAGVAPMSESEAAAQGVLSRYVSGMTPGYQAGLKTLTDTVSGAYDPFTSPYYEGLRAESLGDEDRAVSALRRRSQAGGMFYSSPSLLEEGRVRSEFANKRQTALGGLLETERGRAVAAAPTLMNEPLSRIAAGSQYGALPRTLEQAKQDAAYSALMAKIMFPYTQGQGVATNLWGMGPGVYSTEGGGGGTLAMIAEILPYILAST